MCTRYAYTNNKNTRYGVEAMKTTQWNTEQPINADNLVQRRIKRKTEQMASVKFLLAMVLFVGALMETPMPQPTAAKLALDCPLIQKNKQDGTLSYSIGAQSCSWKVL